MTDDEPEESRRQTLRRQQRADSERSARLAKKLMTMSNATLDRLGLDEELTKTIARSRSITKKARRRAERFLAAELMSEDLDALEKRIADVAETGAAEPRLFKRAEAWRARLIEENDAATEFPGGAQQELRDLIHQARRERDTGKPRGAQRALFRHVFAVLKAES